MLKLRAVSEAGFRRICGRTYCPDAPIALTSEECRLRSNALNREEFVVVGWMAPINRPRRVDFTTLPAPRCQLALKR
jgi:hypothetical protein